MVFDVVGERFGIWITNSQSIQQIPDHEQGTGSTKTPNGRIPYGAGKGEYSVPQWAKEDYQALAAEST
jgi:hypothetical protein